MKKLFALLFTIGLIISCTMEPGRQENNSVESKPEIGQATRANFNPAVQYANSRWRWTRWDHSAGTYKVFGGTNCTAKDVPTSPMGVYFQPNFKCAEFVARALVTLSDPNIFYDLNENWSPSYYYTYKRSSNTYQLHYVGSHGYIGLYDFLINEGYGKEIGTNLSLAKPGDVVFYYDGAPDLRGYNSTNREHVALLVYLSGSIGKVTAHNTACNNTTYNDSDMIPSIVSLRSWVEFYPSYSTSISGSATGSYSPSGKSAVINGNNGSCTLTFNMSGGTRYMVVFDYNFTGYGGGSFTSPSGVVSISSSTSTHTNFEWKSGNCSMYGSGSGLSTVTLANLHFYRMQ